jgi:hypothetical protein
MTVTFAKMLTRLRKVFSKEYDVREIRDGLCNSELHFGDKIKTIGTYSEYLPFIDPKSKLTGKAIQSPLPRTARLRAINDIHYGALFEPEQRDAFAKEVMPIFYGLDSKVLEHYTGEMLELQCQIIQVPAQYQEIINQNSYFTFEKEEGLQIPFGLKVLDAEPYGVVDTFRINAWLLGNLNPAPHLRKIRKTSCNSCVNSFVYMQIDPAEALLKTGCAKYGDTTEQLSEEINKASEDFLEMERNNQPYLVFPQLFSQFEVFYPSVDIFDKKQEDRSKNVLIGVIHGNMERLFKIPLYHSEIITPKAFVLSVDFQYDQLNPITQQTFEPNSVPEWKCPRFAPKLKNEN